MLINGLKQRQISNNLGISQPQISRTRKKIAQKFTEYRVKSTT